MPEPNIFESVNYSDVKISNINHTWDKDDKPITKLTIVIDGTHTKPNARLHNFIQQKARIDVQLIPKSFEPMMDLEVRQVLPIKQELDMDAKVEGSLDMGVPDA